MPIFKFVPILYMIRDYMQGSKIALGIIGIVVIIGIVYLATMQGVRTSLPQAVQGSSQVALQLTDPPHVPSGTQALYINYSSLEAHASGAAGSGWVQSNSSGRINLLELLNLSQTIGTVAVPNGTSIDMVRFFVTSSQITINGTTYNVTLPSGQVTANIQGDTRINASSSVLLSLSPTVVTILTSNTTVFVMVPSVKAVILPNGTNQTTVKVGSRLSLGKEANMELERASPNITITGASLSVSGNATKMSVTVKNNANVSIIIKHIGLYGNVSAAVNSRAIDNNAAQIESELRNRIRNGTLCLNLSVNQSTSQSQIKNLTTEDKVGLGVNVSIGDNRSQGGTGAGLNITAGSGDNGNQGNVTSGNGEHGNELELNSSEAGDIAETIRKSSGLQLNASVCTATGFTQFQSEFRNRITNNSANFGRMQISFKQIHFLVGVNGTLSLPYGIEDFNGTGYQLQQGQSATFSFNGTIITSDHGLTIAPISGSAYTIDVGGEDAATAQANVTAVS